MHMFWLELLIGIGIAVLGGRLKFRRSLLLTTGFVAAFLAVSLVRGSWRTATSCFESYLSRNISAVVSFLLLAAPPLLIVPYLGISLLDWLGFTEDMSDMSQMILGACFMTGLYICLLQVI